MTADTILYEKYISRFISPNEDCLCWVRWDNTKLEFDKLKLATEADIEAVKFFALWIDPWFSSFKYVSHQEIHM